MMGNGIHCFGFPKPPSPHWPTRPVGIVVLASLRDVAGDDRNGQIIVTAQGERRMEGAIERLVKETHQGGMLHGLARLAAVVTDDRDVDMQRLGCRFPVRPQPGLPWIHPLDLRNPDGTLIAGTNVTHAVVSHFRSLPLHARDERHHAKKQFENQVLKIMRQRNADVLLTDHYMARIEFLIDRDHGLAGRVLNIHPAITLAESPHHLRGRSPTRDALQRARTKSPTRTGATLHFTNSEFDAGQVIAYSLATRVRANESALDLKYRNYQLAKLPVLGLGLRHFLLNIYPQMKAGKIPSLFPLEWIDSMRAA